MKRKLTALVIFAVWASAGGAQRAFAKDVQKIASLEELKGSAPPAGTAVSAVPDDIAEALEKARAGAGPTEEYHEKLLKIAKDASALKAAQLNAILDACFVPASEREKLVQEEERLQEEPYSRANEKRMRELGDQIHAADQLGSYSNRIILAGLPKTTDLALDNGIELLEKLYPQTGSSKAFRLVFGKFSTFSTDQEYQLMKLASRKAAGDVAVVLGTDWFKNHSDKSIDTMGKVAKDLTYNAKDDFLVQALEAYPSLSTQEMLRIAKFADSSTKVVMARYDTVSDLTPGNAVKLVNVVSGDNKDVIIRKCLDSRAKVSTSELVTLAEAAWNAKNSVLTTYRRKVSDPTVDNTIKLVDAANGDNKDAIIMEFLNSRADLTTGDLGRLAEAAWNNKNTILTGYWNKASDLDVSNLLGLVNKASGDNKDKLIMGFLNSRSKLTTDELAKLAESAWNNKNAILVGYWKKAGDLDLAKVRRLIDMANGDNKDVLIAGYLDSAAALTTDELAQLADAAWNSKNSILKDHLKKLSDATVPNVVRLAGMANGDNKDVLLHNYLGAREQVTTSELIALSGACWNSSSQFMRDGLGKVSDLTVSNAIRIAETLNYQAKAEFVLGAVDKVIDLSAANLPDLASHADYKEKEVLQRGIKRLAGGK